MVVPQNKNVWMNFAKELALIIPLALLFRYILLNFVYPLVVPLLSMPEGAILPATGLSIILAIWVVLKWHKESFAQLGFVKPPSFKRMAIVAVVALVIHALVSVGISSILTQLSLSST